MKKILFEDKTYIYLFEIFAFTSKFTNKIPNEIIADYFEKNENIIEILKNLVNNI